jgi:hypothetical protein
VSAAMRWLPGLIALAALAGIWLGVAVFGAITS